MALRQPTSWSPGVAKVRESRLSNWPNTFALQPHGVSDLLHSRSPEFCTRCFGSWSKQTTSGARAEQNLNAYGPKLGARLAASARKELWPPR